MPNIFDVVHWFLHKQPMSHKKLQKLCYYYKAWGLALYDYDPLPDAVFQAWVHGPVNPALYRKYKHYYWSDIPMHNSDNSNLFNNHELELLESVWFTYGNISANALEVQTRSETPWRTARHEANEFETSTNVISNEDMKTFYREIYSCNQGE